MNQSTFKAQKYWILTLTSMWLIATFEHNYYTLSKYTHPVFLAGIPIADISAFLIVLALDLSIFWSVYFIPQGRISSMPLGGVKSILIIATVISVALNVLYMYTAALGFSDPTILDVSIGIFVGVLIPLFVVIFGWVEGNIAIRELDRQINKNGNNGNRVPTEDEVAKAILEHGNASARKLAKILNSNKSTVQTRIQSLREKGKI